MSKKSEKGTEDREWEWQLRDTGNFFSWMKVRKSPGKSAKPKPDDDPKEK